ncbi:very-long-chain 3-oxoacyl-CoA reductase-like protein [Senna tora]|uniref:Very-long-chain 3-oxoacyl-CoA reductase-like protein n=1 Tax=Senna tora TaxID=362788 RepID=A0A834WC35_9FABA|nr:very-long-chain 3-oxoacyl-CoA reductase-like protein [Senna tora]
MVGRTVITCSESELQRFLIIIIASLGFLILLKHFIFFLSWILHTFLRSEKDLIGTYGSWALITGATDGIGKAFALGLARRGLNLILVSRSSGKLRSVSEEIRAEFPRSEIRTVEIDFSDDGGGGGGMKRLREAVLDGGAVDLGILVNNVGITYPEARRGAIVNIGSGAGIVVPSHPLYAIYGATKA